MNNNVNYLNVKYSFLQGFYWMEYGIVFSFASVYLLDKGLNSSQIGVFLAIANLLAVVFQSPMASFADRTKRITLSQICIFISVIMIMLCGLMFLFSKSIMMGVSSLLLCATLIMMLQPLTSAVGMFFLNRGYPLNFGITRGLGSISYAIITAIMGFMIEGFGTNAICVGLGIICVGLLFTAYSLNTSKNLPNLLGDSSNINHSGEPLSIIAFAKKYKRFMCMLIGVIFIFSTHTSLSTYLYQIMQNVNGGSKDVGISLSISAIAELPTMFGFYWIIKKWKSKTLLRCSAIFFTVKSFVYVIATSIGTIHLAQTIQVLGYALFTPTVIYYVNQLVREEDSVKGQALATTAITAGGILGSLVCGQLVVALGVTKMLFSCSILSLIGSIIVFLSVEDTKQI